MVIWSLQKMVSQTLYTIRINVSQISRIGCVHYGMNILENDQPHSIQEEIMLECFYVANWHNLIILVKIYLFSLILC